MMPPQIIELCRLETLAEGSSRGFDLSASALRDNIFVVRTGAGVFAYRNCCPHTGGPLDWVPNRFLNLEGDLIQCATHAALFRIEDGLCIAGPCVGQSLSAVNVSVRAQRLCVSVEAPDEP